MSMKYSTTSKALAVSALSLLLLTSCGQPAINVDADPTQVLSEARANLVQSASALAEKTASGTEEGTLEFNLTNPQANAKIGGSFDMSGMKNDFGVALNLNGDVTSPLTGKLSGKVSAEIRLIAGVIYGNLMEVSATAEQPALQTEIDNALAMMPMFTNKWIKSTLKDLLASSPEEAAALEAALAKDSVESAKSILAKLNENEIFTVQEKLAPQDGMHVYKVIPNKAGVLALVQSINTEFAQPALTPEATAELEQMIDLISGENVTHMLYIDGNNVYRKFVSTGTSTTPDMTADVTSTLTLDKDLNGTWVVDVKATDTATSESFTVALNAEYKNMTTDFKLTFDAPSASMQTKFDLAIKSVFKAGTPTIAVPAESMDAAQLLGGAPVAPSTGTTMEEDTATDSDDSIETMDSAAVNAQ